MFKLGGIKFIFKIYNNILKENISDLFLEIEKYLEINSLLLINSYIFTSYIDNQKIINFSKKYPTNLIYSRDENFFNIQILCINKNDNFSFEYLKNDNKNFGINIKNKFLDILFLNGLDFNNGDFIKQTNYIYNLLFLNIKNFGYNNQNIIKAWNFIGDVLINYNDFNLIRDKFFLQQGLLNNFPAGTGIDCILPGNIKHSSSFFLLKLKEKSIKIETLSSSLQCEANNYGPKFSRAKLITSTLDNNNILIISGTAAVDNNGKSIFIDNIDENIKFTFKSVENLLKQSGMGFNNIISSFIYIKNKKFYENFLNIYKNHNFNFPYIYNFCDICRDDFLFEIECIAVKNN